MGNEARAGYRPDLMVRLASEGDASYIGEGIYEESPAVQSRSQAAFPGIAAQFRVLLRNAGDQADSFVVTAPASGSGFTVSYLDQGGVDRAALVSGAGYRTQSLAPGEGVVVSVQVSLAEFTLGASYRVVVSAASVGDPAAVDRVKTETVACGLTAAVTVSAPPDASGPPGGVVNYPYTVINVGNSGNSFALSLQNLSGWQGELFADDGAGGGTAGDGVRQGGENNRCVATGVLPAGASYRLFAAVTVPPSGVDGARGDARLAVTGDGASGSDQVNTSAVAAVVTVSEGVRNLTRGGGFAAGVEAVPGDLLQYRMSVTNSGSAPAASLSIESPVPPELQLISGSLLIALAPEGEASACAPSQCGFARALDAGIVARLGEGATDAAGGALAPGKTVYLFFKAQVQ